MVLSRAIANNIYTICGTPSLERRYPASRNGGFTAQEYSISIHTFEYRCRIVRQTMENLLSEKQPSVQFAELDVQPSVPETSGIRIQASGISVEFFPDADCNQIKTVMEVLCHAAK